MAGARNTAQHHIIKCIDCGADYSTKRRNTKYCAICRLRKDLLFLTTRTVQCWDCEAIFAPINSADVLCAECEPSRKRYGVGECKLCEAPQSTLLIPGLAICTKCVRDPKRRATVVQKLGSRIRWQKARPIEQVAA